MRKAAIIEINDCIDYSGLKSCERTMAPTAMASITIRNIQDTLKAQLRIRAAHHHRSMEEEAREILRLALASPLPEESNLAAAIRRRFAPLGGADLVLPPREPIREPPDLET